MYVNQFNQLHLKNSSRLWYDAM